MRTKSDYVVNLKEGKHVPEKIGLKNNFRDGIEYEFTIVLDIDLKHNATASKDRTNLFMGKPEFKITADTGRIIKNWCESGTTIDDVKKEVKEAKSLDHLTDIYRRNAHLYIHLQDEFNAKKAELNAPIQQVNPELINPLNFSTNGSSID
jgi:hypothetical protein